MCICGLGGLCPRVWDMYVCLVYVHVCVCVREREGERERERERERARERESKLVPQVFAGCSQEGKQVYPYTLSFIPPCSSVLNR